MGAGMNVIDKDITSRAAGRGKIDLEMQEKSSPSQLLPNSGNSKITSDSNTLPLVQTKFSPDSETKLLPNSSNPPRSLSPGLIVSSLGSPLHYKTNKRFVFVLDETTEDRLKRYELHKFLLRME